MPVAPHPPAVTDDFISAGGFDYLNDIGRRGVSSGKSSPKRNSPKIQGVNFVFDTVPTVVVSACGWGMKRYRSNFMRTIAAVWPVFSGFYGIKAAFSGRISREYR
jgi:hypothetical protein